MAMRAASAIGLDVAGVDFITPDVTRSYREVGGAICEINAAPGFRMHVAPTEGRILGFLESTVMQLDARNRTVL